MPESLAEQLQRLRGGAKAAPQAPASAGGAESLQSQLARLRGGGTATAPAPTAPVAAPSGLTPIPQEMADQLAGGRYSKPGPSFMDREAAAQELFRQKGVYSEQEVEALAQERAPTPERYRQRVALEFSSEYLKSGGNKQNLQAMLSRVNWNDPQQIEEMRAFTEQAARKRYEFETGSPGVPEGVMTASRIAGAPMRGALAPLRLAGVDIDPAKAGEVMAGGTGEYTDRARAEAGVVERSIEGGAEMVGAMTTMGGAGRVVGQLPAAVGYAGASAPEGERREAMIRMGLLSIGGGWAQGKFEKGLSKLAPVPRAITSGVAANVGTGAAIDTAMGNGYTPEQAIMDAVFGAATAAPRARALGFGAMRPKVDARKADRAFTEAETRAALADPNRPEAQAYRESVQTAFDEGRGPLQAEVAESQREWAGVRQDIQSEAPPVPKNISDLRGELTQEEAGAAKVAYVQQGGDPARVADPVRAQAVADAIGRGEDPVAAAESVPAKPAPGGGTTAGYKPTEQAIADGDIAPRAVPLVKRAEAEGVKTVSSGVDPKTGEAYVVGVDPTGKVVERTEQVQLPAPEPVKRTKGIGVGKRPKGHAKAEAKAARMAAETAPAPAGPLTVAETPTPTPPKVGMAPPAADVSTRLAGESRGDSIRGMGKAKTVRDAALQGEGGGVLGLTWDQIHAAQTTGKIPRQTIDTSKAARPAATNADRDLLAKHGENGLREMGFWGALDRLGLPLEPPKTGSGPVFRPQPEPDMTGFKYDPSKPGSEDFQRSQYKMAQRRRTQDPEGGVVVLPSAKEVGEAFKRGGKAVANIANKAARPFKRTLSRVADHGYAGVRLAEEGERALDKRIDYDKTVGLVADEAAALTHKDQAHELTQPDFLPGKDYGLGKMGEALEGRLATTGDVKAAVDATRNHLDASLAYKHAEGWQRETPTGWQPIPQKSGAAPRMLSEDGINIIKSGGPEWDRWVDNTVDANKGLMPEAEVRRVMQAWREGLANVAPEAVEAVAAAEIQRALPRLPAWQKGANGDNVMLLEQNLHRYNVRFHRSSAARVGVTSVFGQGPKDRIPKLRAEWYGRGDKRARADFDDLMRALHEMPMSDPFFQGGEPGSGAARLGMAALNISRGAHLSANAITSGVGEFLGGPTARTARIQDHVKGLVRFISNPKAAAMELFREGFKTRDHRDHTIRDDRKITDRANKLADTLRHLGSTWMEEGQETGGGKVGQALRERAMSNMGKKPVSPDDVAMLRQLGFTEAQAERMWRSPAENQRLWNRAMRRLVQETQGSNTSAAQLSPFEHSRTGKILVSFKKYGMMAARNNIKALGTSVKMMAEGVAEKNFGKIRAGVAIPTKMYGSLAVAGTVNSLIAALFMRGPEGLGQEWRKLVQDPLDYTWGSVKAQFLAGPAGALMRVASDEQDVWSLIYPVAVTRELLKATGVIDSAGKYEGAGIGERLWKWTQQAIPLSKTLDTGLVSMLWSDQEYRQFNAARRALYDWKRDKGLIGGFGSGNRDAFDKAMSKVYKSVQRGDDPEVWTDLMVEAAMAGQETGKAEPMKSVRASLLGKRLLDDLNSQQKLDLFDRLGDEAMYALMAHDALLERVATGR